MTPDPSQWYAISKATDVATVGKTFTATFIQCEKKVFENLSESLECELVSELYRYQSKRQFREKRTEPVRGQLPANHQGETPAPHQSHGGTHHRKSTSCGSELISHQTRSSALQYEL